MIRSPFEEGLGKSLHYILSVESQGPFLWAPAASSVSFILIWKLHKGLKLFIGASTFSSAFLLPCGYTVFFLTPHLLPLGSTMFYKSSLKLSAGQVTLAVTQAFFIVMIIGHTHTHSCFQW